jgi:hypothetical protein
MNLVDPIVPSLKSKEGTETTKLMDPLFTFLKSKEMTVAITTALAAILTAIIPIIVTKVVSWFDRRSLESKQQRAFDLAHKKITFLDEWFQLQERFSEPEALSLIKAACSKELMALRESIQEHTVPRKETIHTIKELPSLTRLFLFYRPPDWLGWIGRLIYYIMFGVITLAEWERIENMKAVQLPSEYFFEFLTYALVLIFFMLPAWLLTNWVDLRAERRAKNTTPSHKP